MHNVIVKTSAAEAQIPAIGFGTWQLTGAQCEGSVTAALRCGYRHIDTASRYGNEEEVGAAIASSSIPRHEIFLTTKVWTDSFTGSTLPASVEESLKKLKTDHVDLLLLHWPNPAVDLAETIDALVGVRKRGLATNIGVSNFPVALWQQATQLSGDTIVTNQVEYHPFLNQNALLEYTQSSSQSLTAYSPVAQGKVATDPVIRELAQAYHKTENQITLRWLIQQPQVIAIPRSTNPERIKQQFEISDFELSDEDMQRIDALRSNQRLVNPGFAPKWDQAA